MFFRKRINKHQYGNSFGRNIRKILIKIFIILSWEIYIFYIFFYERKTFSFNSMNPRSTPAKGMPIVSIVALINPSMHPSIQPSDYPSMRPSIRPAHQPHPSIHLSISPAATSPSNERAYSICLDMNKRGKKDDGGEGLGSQYQSQSYRSKGRAFKWWEGYWDMDGGWWVVGATIWLARKAQKRKRKLKIWSFWRASELWILFQVQSSVAGWK